MDMWKWLGQLYRRNGPVHGRRGRGRPRETWQRTIKREVGDECWGDLEEIAQDRRWWREFIEALCIPEGATGYD
ncbi:hypothetical protein E2C01_082382 [Portunus trituberculatus]|uniref:Uncharacterized protein n=1 Tax=Portunus trituberculatus TaxID=210409 RepID=A0A5B7IYY5_PORTR|nr:hypothetical protein [Portunus trituberculatus]